MGTVVQGIGVHRKLKFLYLILMFLLEQNGCGVVASVLRCYAVSAGLIAAGAI